MNFKARFLTTLACLLLGFAGFATAGGKRFASNLSAVLIGVGVGMTLNEAFRREDEVFGDENDDSRFY
jgi:hypothetical protein